MTIKILLAELIFISLCTIQAVNISGTVTNINGMPVIGANVILENVGISDTTETNGEFLLVDAVEIIDQKQSQPYIRAIRILNGFLCVNVQKKSLIEGAAYTLQGKVVSEIRKTIDAGIHSIALPNVGAGIYFYHIKIGNNKFVLKNHSIGNVSVGTIISTGDLTTTIPSSLSNSRIPTGDVIKVTKNGYLDYQMVITNLDTNGIEIKLITHPGTIVDIDGNVYHTIKIGSQTWTIENLRTTKYNDGSTIPLITNDTTWSTLTTPGCCYYNNTTNVDSIEKYGALYNWHAVNTGKLAPTGWHISTNGEWDTLQNYLIANGFNWDGTTEGNKTAKSLAANIDWKEPDTGIGTVGMDLSKNNKSGFSGLPTGYCYDANGQSYGFGLFCYWWSSTSYNTQSAYCRELAFNSAGFIKCGIGKRWGLPIRLLQDAN